MHNVASWPCCRSRRRSNSSAIRGKADSQATTQIRRKCPELTKSSNCQMHDIPSSTRTPPVDNTDWLKTAAIIAVAIGHFGHFFMENDHWWAVFGRVAAPAFFFLQGYAESRTIPLRAAGYVDSHPQGRGAHQVRNGDQSQVLGLDVPPAVLVRDRR